MDSIKKSWRKLKYKLRHDFLTVENVVLVVAFLFCLVWTYQSILAMSRNWELSERLMTQKKNLELVSLEIAAMELENEYYQTDEYQELMSRKDLDKKWSGENLVVLPENSEDAKNKHKKTESKVEEKTYSNFEKWMLYLFPKYE